MATTPCELTAADEYTPVAGDRFHRPAGEYYDPTTGTKRAFPEHNATVKEVRDSFVTCEVDGRMMHLAESIFIKLAKNTLAHGATLSREILKA